MSVSLNAVGAQTGSINIPSGMIAPYAGESAPSGWLLCNGASYSQSTYQNLYNTIGTSFGGSGSSFNVPNFNSRVPVCYNSNDGTCNVIGLAGGETNHTLVTNELPSHDHQIGDTSHYHGWQDGGHSHQLSYSTVQFVAQGSKPACIQNLGPGNQVGYQTQQSGAGIQIQSSQAGIGLAQAGQDAGHYNLMPYLTVTYIIKT